MSEKPKKRPLFQYHLSTAIVVMFVASGVLWLNVRLDNWPYQLGGRLVGESLGRGWPLMAIRHQGGYHHYKEITVNGQKQWQEWNELMPNAEIELCPNGIIIDAVVAFAILGIIGYFCEWLIRRKAAKVEAQKKETANV